MRHQLYDVLRKLRKSYPFTPEQLGYTLMEDKLLEPRSWIEDFDKLVDLEGSHIEKNLTLKAIVPTCQSPRKRGRGIICIVCSVKV
jgi:hypothetical protein